MWRKLITIILYCISFSSYSQTVTTIAGNGNVGYTGDGGPAIYATIGSPGFIAFDHQNNLYISEYNNTIRKISTAGVITKVAGSGVAGFGGDDSLAINAKLNMAGGGGMAFDKFDNLYIADYLNHRIRKVDALTGIITTIAGTGTAGFAGDNGPATSAMINGPTSLAFDTASNLYLSDGLNYRIRKVDNLGVITTFAGIGSAGYIGDDGPAINAQMNAAAGMQIANVNDLYFADGAKIRKINLLTNIITSLAGNGTQGYSGDGGLADSAALWLALDVAVDVDGNFFISDMDNDRIRKVGVNDTINTIVGTGIGGYNGDTLLAFNTKIYSPRGIALDSCGNLYISDNGNRRIRKVTFNPNCSITDTTTVDTTDTSTAVLSMLHKDNDVHIYPTLPKRMQR